MANQNPNNENCSASKLRIVAFNARSIGKNPKRANVLEFLKQKDPDILVISETKIDKTVETEIRTEWDGEVFFSSLSGQARGVAIFKKKNLPVTILNQHNDGQGNLLALLIEYEGKKILLQGVYGPNTDEPDFYANDVFDKIEAWNAEFSIFVGDWNVTLDTTKDNKFYLHDNNPNARREILMKMDEYNLVDIWRQYNPDAQQFTWHKPGLDRKLARLDYFLISNSLLPYVEDTTIKPGCFSDHSVISLDIDFSKFKMGKGFWKFNSSLLSDPTYLELIKKTIARVVMQYATVNDDPNFYLNATPAMIEQFFNEQTPETLQNLPLNINPELFLDTLLMEIRRETICMAAAKKRERLAQQQLIAHDIEALELLTQTFPDDLEAADRLQTRRTEQEEIINVAAQGAYIRARTKHKVDGERPTRLFCSLEKHNGVQKYIPCLKVNRVINDEVEEVIITNQEEIKDETVKFYKELYRNHDDKITTNIEDFLDDSAESLPKLFE